MQLLHGYPVLAIPHMRLNVGIKVIERHEWRDLHRLVWVSLLYPEAGSRSSIRAHYVPYVPLFNTSDRPRRARYLSQNIPLCGDSHVGRDDC